MGCCCCGQDVEEDDDEREFHERAKGPTLDRRCTDVLWVPIFVIWWLSFFFVCYHVIVESDTERLEHGQDHKGRLCGKDEMKEKPRVYFPRLAKDFAEDKTLHNRYGVCVEKCPKQFAFVEDEDFEGDPKKRWFVPLPSFSAPLINRCVPYKDPKPLGDGSELCADPKCSGPPAGGAKAAERPEQMCGPDGTTGEYWVIKPGSYVKNGWRKSMEEDEVEKLSEIAKRGEKQSRKKCDAVLLVNTELQPDQSQDPAILRFVTVFTGQAMRQALFLWHNSQMIATLSGPGAFLLSAVLLMLFSYFARCIIPTLVLVGFVVLGALDYILFVKAGLATGRTGKAVMDRLGVDKAAHEMDDYLGAVGASDLTGLSAHDVTHQMLTQGSTEMAFYYKGCAWGLLVAIALLLCLCCALKRNYKVLVALLREAATTIREMPSLLVLPILVNATIFCAFMLFAMRTALGVLTLHDESWLGNHIVSLHVPFDTGRFYLAWVLIFCFLWIYNFHMAVFRTTVAGAVAHWYFYRNDPDHNAGTGIHSNGYCFGRPVICALARVLRYHLGTMVFGSFVIALCTMPRLIFEYVVAQTGEPDGDSNAVTRCAYRCIRSVLACLERVVKMMTSQAFVNVAISGRSLCAAGMRTVELMAKYPAQVFLDQLSGWALNALACVLVPSILVGVSFVMVTIEEGWAISALAIAGMSVLVTRMAVGVYDIAMSTLFQCSMRDVELYGGQYAPESLHRAMGIMESQARKSKRHQSVRDVEMSHSGGL